MEGTCSGNTWIQHCSPSLKGEKIQTPSYTDIIIINIIIVKRINPSVSSSHVCGSSALTPLGSISWRFKATLKMASKHSNGQDNKHPMVRIINFPLIIHPKISVLRMINFPHISWTIRLKYLPQVPSSGCFREGIPQLFPLSMTWVWFVPGNRNHSMRIWTLHSPKLRFAKTGSDKEAVITP